MDIDDRERIEVINRIRRARGQLDGVLAMIEDGRTCNDVVTQLAAASSAIDRAAFRLLAISLQQCYVEGQVPDTETAKNLEKLLMSLA
jgi:DNA-binding FrmR family transcriptional regulator